MQVSCEDLLQSSEHSLFSRTPRPHPLTLTTHNSSSSVRPFPPVACTSPAALPPALRPSKSCIVLHFAPLLCKHKDTNYFHQWKCPPSPNFNSTPLAVSVDKQLKIVPNKVDGECVWGAMQMLALFFCFVCQP